MSSEWEGVAGAVAGANAVGRSEERIVENCCDAQDVGGIADGSGSPDVPGRSRIFSGKQASVACAQAQQTLDDLPWLRKAIVGPLKGRNRTQKRLEDTGAICAVNAIT